MKVAAIVVTYNRKTLLLEAIAALLNQTYSSMDVLVIDNASTDGTREAVGLMIPNDRIRYFHTGANLGGAGGFNYGLKVAYQEGYDAFWLMDDDSIVQEGALEAIIHAANLLKDKFGFLCSNVRWTDGTACKMNVPRIDERWSEYIEQMRQGIIPVKIATFVGFYLTRAMVEKIGLPIKEFYIWSDDSNYSMRANREAACYCVVDSVIVHKMKSNSSSDIVSDESDRLSRYFYSYRNKLYNARYEKRVGQYMAQLLKQSVMVIIRAKHKNKKLYYMYKGFFAGLRFNPMEEYVE